VDWPSRELSQRLAEWRLCTPRDVQRCQTIVRRLSRDLPTFDSLWIDALAQSRLITPFQAKVLDSDAPDRLRIGSFILIDRLEEDAFRGVYRARTLTGSDNLLLTVHEIHPDDLSGVIERLNGVISRARMLPDAGIATLRAVEVAGSRVIAISGNVEGTTLKDFLIRRGRFPAAVVLALARHIAVSLAALEQSGLVHGDVRPRNVRLSERGAVHLLHAGLLPALAVQPSVSMGLPVDLFDGLAPELASGTNLATSASDQYGLGCVVWQLLAGRPPFPTGDPAAKLAMHHSRSIPDLTNYAPDTPRQLVEFIARSTCKRPDERFSSFAEVLRLLGAPSTSDRRRLRRFVTSFQSEPPRQTIDAAATAPRHVTTTLAVVALAGTVVFLGQSGWTSGLLSQKGTKAAKVVATAQGTAATNAQNTQSTAASGDNAVTPASFVTNQGATGIASNTTNEEAVPRSRPDGTLTLNAGKTYSARAINVRGPLLIQASAGPPARVIVPASGWDLQADEIHLVNVEIVFDGSTNESSAVRARCRRLGLAQCRIRDLAQAPPSNGSEVAKPPMIEWTPDDSRTATGGTITIEDCHFHDVGLSCKVRPVSIVVTNTLKTGAAPLIRLADAGRAHQNLQVRLDHITLRGQAPLVAWKPASRAAGLRTEIDARACVLDVESVPLLEMDAPAPPPEWERSLTVTGMETIITPMTTLVGLADSKKDVDAGRLSVEGLLAGNVEFRGTNVNLVSDSELLSTDAVRSTKSLPGIDALKLPQASE
jgi:eukaryotic-like serine/threonine-protein kinase